MRISYEPQDIQDMARLSAPRCFPLIFQHQNRIERPSSLVAVKGFFPPFFGPKSLQGPSMNRSFSDSTNNTL